jgi:Zn-dependent peptidase ImmA (M78 family)
VNAPSFAEAKAIDVLDELGLKNALPVDVDEIAIALGADLQYEAYEGDVSGMLYRYDGGTSVIGVNSRHALTRQRFTVAHEIAHLVMHKGQPMFVDTFIRVNRRDGASNREEAEANAFAAELLMPRRLIEREVDKALNRQQTITAQELAAQLARLFKVSAEAMSYRLQNLGVVDPLALVS